MVEQFTIESSQLIVRAKARKPSQWKSGSMGSMRPGLQRLTFLSIVVLAFTGTGLSDASKAPFSLSIVPTNKFGEVGSIEMAQSKPGDFYIVLTNVSKDPQAVWEFWNSWGYQNISFELTTAEGRKFVVSQRQQDFTVNFPSTFLIQPGEHQVYAIRLDKDWETRPVLPKADEMPITLKAIYEVSATPEAARYKVWTGRIESRSYKFTLRQW